MANSSALQAVQDAVFDALAADATLAALATVLGYEPAEPPSEFIVVGSGATEEAWNTLGGANAGWGWETNVTVHLYSYYPGDLKVLQMLSRVTALLNIPTGFASISGYSTVIAEYGEKPTRVVIETKDKRERRHIPAVFTIRVHE